MARPTTPSIPHGNPLRYEVTGVRNRMCGVVISRGYVDLNTGVMVHQELVPAGFVPLGRFRQHIEAQLPATMLPSRYAMRGLQTNDCGSEVIILRYPDVVFEIVNQG